MATGKKATLRQKLAAMEKALEKGVSDIGRRVKGEMPAVKEKVAKAGKAVAKTSSSDSARLKIYPPQTIQLT